MKEAEELLNRLDNYHKDFRRDRLKIVEEFLEKNVVAPEPRKPRMGWMHAFRLHDTLADLEEHYGQLADPIYVREVSE